MTDKQRALCESLADKEWNDYQEHLRLGGNKLHVRSFFRLGFAAGVENEQAECEILKSRASQFESTLKETMLARDVAIARTAKLVEALQKISSGMTTDQTKVEFYTKREAAEALKEFHDGV